MIMPRLNDNRFYADILWNERVPRKLFPNTSMLRFVFWSNPSWRLISKYVSSSIRGDVNFTVTVLDLNKKSPYPDDDSVSYGLSGSHNTKVAAWLGQAAVTGVFTRNLLKGDRFPSLLLDLFWEDWSERLCVGPQLRATRNHRLRIFMDNIFNPVQALDPLVKTRGCSPGAAPMTTVRYRSLRRPSVLEVAASCAGLTGKLFSQLQSNAIPNNPSNRFQVDWGVMVRKKNLWPHFE